MMSLIKLYLLELNTIGNFEDSNKRNELHLVSEEGTQETWVPCTAAIAPELLLQWN